jgi:flagellar hook-basal body complex protein FliE
MTISGITPIVPLAPLGVESAQSTPGGEAFQSAFADALSKVEGFQENAKASVDRFLSGEGEELHQVALAAKQAELSFDLFLQVRNKVVNAYEEVMRMQV